MITCLILLYEIRKRPRITVHQFIVGDVFPLVKINGRVSEIHETLQIFQIESSGIFYCSGIPLFILSFINCQRGSLLRLVFALHRFCRRPHQINFLDCWYFTHGLLAVDGSLVDDVFSLLVLGVYEFQIVVNTRQNNPIFLDQYVILFKLINFIYLYRRLL